MLRNKSVMIVVGVLFTIVVIYNLNFFMKKKAPVRPQEKAATALPPDAKDRPGEFRMTSHFQVPRDKDNWKRDPFRYKVDETNKAAREKTKAAGIKLQGITARDGKRFALVNGWVVGSGDRIDNVLITDITPYSIFVKDADGIREINIYTDIPDKEK